MKPRAALSAGGWWDAGQRWLGSVLGVAILPGSWLRKGGCAQGSILGRRRKPFWLPGKEKEKSA